MPEARWYPALDVRWAHPAAPEHIEAILAVVDDFSPAAVDEQPGSLRIFFTDAAARDNALRAVQRYDGSADVAAASVSDEAWAERSQSAIGPVRVGRIVVAPPWAAGEPAQDAPLTIVIQPSMGFGTGHHASTRLCLSMLQSVPLDGARVLDVGTGSGVLAIAAASLGARRVLGIDYDPDALASAQENVDRNGMPVELRRLDLTSEASALAERFDVVTANLTGAMLERHAGTLVQWIRPGGTLIVSGVRAEEETSVAAAFSALGLSQLSGSLEDGWVSLQLRL